MKSPFLMYEHVHFFFGQDADLTQMQKVAKRNEVLELLDDIALLIEGDHTNPGYSRAFGRATEHYQEFPPENLPDYYRYLTQTFNLKAPTCPIIKKAYAKNFERL